MTQAQISPDEWAAFLRSQKAPAGAQAPTAKLDVSPEEFGAFAASRHAEPGWGEATARGAGAFGLEAGRGFVSTFGMGLQGPQALFESADQIRNDVLDWFGVSKEAKERLGAMAKAGTFVARGIADAAAAVGEPVQKAAEAIPRDERYSDRLIGQVGSGVGQSIATIGVGAATGGVGAGALAVSSSVEYMQQQAERLGATDSQKAVMALGGVPIGLIEMAGIERAAPAFGRVLKAKFGQKAVDDVAEHMTEHWIRRTAMQGTVEAGEEVIQNGIQWGLEKYTGADPNATLDFYESLKEEGVPAFIAATLLGAPMNKIMADSRGQVLTEAGSVKLQKQAEALDAERQKLVEEPIDVEAAQKRTQRLSAAVLAKTSTPVRIVDRHDDQSAGWVLLGKKLGVDVVVGEWDDTSAPATHLDGVVLVNRKAGDDRVVRSLVFHEGAHAMLRAMGPEGEAKGKELLAAFGELMPGFLEQSETIYRSMAEKRKKKDGTPESMPGDTHTIEGTPFEEEGFAHSIERMAALLDVAMSGPKGQRALSELLRKDRTVGEWMLDGLKDMLNRLPGVRMEKSVQARMRAADELMQAYVKGDTKGMKGTDAIQLAFLIAETFDQLGPQIQQMMAARKASKAGAATDAAKAGEQGQEAQATAAATPSEAQNTGASAVEAPQPQRPEAKGDAARARGRASVLELPGGDSKPVTYEIVELGTITPSHDPKAGFKPRPGGDKNERPYHDPVEGKDLRDRVMRNAADLKPGFLITDTPAATDGPPIVNEKGQVLGGNARTMVMELAYAKRGEQADRLRAALEDSADAFGIDPAVVATMRAPVLIRRLADADAGAQGELSRVLNDPFTAPRTLSADAVSRGSKIDERAAQTIAAAIGDGSLSEALSDRGSRTTILQALNEVEALTDADVAKMFRGQDGTMTEAAKEMIAATLLGAVISDVRVLSAMPPNVRGAIMKSLPSLVRANAIWPPFGGIIEHAVETLNEARAAGLSVDEIATQQTIEDAAWRHDPRGIALARALEADLAAGPKYFGRRMAALAEALHDAAQGQGNLFGGGGGRLPAQEFDAQVGADGAGVRPGGGAAADPGQAQIQFALGDKNAQGLYSKLERVLRDEIKQQKFTGEQLLAMLKTKGVSKDELEWYRLAEYVEATKRPTYTKDEIADWIERVRPRITETVLAKTARDRTDALEREALEAYEARFDRVSIDYGGVIELDAKDGTDGFVTFADDRATWTSDKIDEWRALFAAASVLPYGTRGALFGDETTDGSLSADSLVANQLERATFKKMRASIADPETRTFLDEHGEGSDLSHVEVWLVTLPGGQAFYYFPPQGLSTYGKIRDTDDAAQDEVYQRADLYGALKRAETMREEAFVNEYMAKRGRVDETPSPLLRSDEQDSGTTQYGEYTSHPNSQGSDNYVEVMVQVKAASGVQPMDATGGVAVPNETRNFRVSDHFAGLADRNRLMHYRADIFYAEWDGETHKVAAQEETQSDPHQKAKEKRAEIIKDLRERVDLSQEEAEKLVPVDAPYLARVNADAIRAARKAVDDAQRDIVFLQTERRNRGMSGVSIERVLAPNQDEVSLRARSSGNPTNIAIAIEELSKSPAEQVASPNAYLATEQALIEGRPVEYLPGKTSADIREIAAGLLAELEKREVSYPDRWREANQRLREADRVLAELDPRGLGAEPLMVDQPWRKTQSYSALSLKLLLSRVAKDPSVEFIAWPSGVEHVKRYSNAMRQVTKRLEWKTVTISREVGETHERRRPTLPLRVEHRGGAWLVLDANGDQIRAFKFERIARETAATLSEPIIRLDTIEGNRVGDFPLTGKSTVHGKSLEDVVGVAIANDIRTAVASGNRDGAFEGEEIRIGSKGMEGAYDKIMPSAAKDIGKKYGAVPELKKVTVNGRTMDFWVMPITPELRAAVLGPGLPQFALQLDDLESMGRAARKAEKQGESTRVGSSPNPIANESTDPGYRAVQRGVREVWSEGFEPVTRAEQQRAAEARLAADFAGERKRLMEKVDRGELPTADEQIELKLMATRLVGDFLAGNSVDPKDFQEAAEANEAAELLYTYFEARAGAGRALGVIRDAFRANRTGKQHLADLVLTLSPDIRRQIKLQREKISSIETTPFVKQQARDEIRRLYAIEAERVRKAQEALRSAGFDPRWVASSYFNDPSTFARIARIVANAKQGPWDWLIELRLANMLSAPITHASNVTGNAVMMAVNQHLQRNAAALLNLAAQSPDAPTFGEQTAFYGSWLGAAMQAGRNFALSWKTELPIFEFEMQRNGYVIPGGWGTKVDDMGGAVLPGEFGRLARSLSLRLLTAADEFFKTLAAITEGHALAWREATREGLTGEEREKRIEALMHGPTSHIHERALVTAKRLTFQGERGQITRSVLAARSAVNDAMPGAFPLGSIMLPFVGTPTAIFEEAIGLPFHPIKTTYKAIAAALGKPYEGGKAQGVEDAARSAIAIGFVLAALAMAYDDDEETGLPRITGAAPRDAGDRDLAYRTAPPMSVRIGSTYYSYARIEPFSTTLGALVDAARKFREEGTGAAFGAFVRAIPPIAADKTYLETVGEIYKIAQAQGDIGDKLARMSLYTFVTPMMPNILRSGARSTDDVMRANPVRKYDDAGLWEATARSLPYQALPVEAIAPPPKYDLWGRPVEKQAAWFSRLVNPASATQDVEKVLDLDLLLRNYQARFERGEIKDNGAREITPTSPDYSFTYKGERHYMTDAEYERLQRDAGQLALRSLKGEFSPLQVRSPEWEDVRKIADEIRSAREIVRNRIINDRRRKGAL